jgi:ribosomal protein S18 acetylase RimI-like enzyme
MTADIKFRKAIDADLPQIWEILQQAIQRRKKEGSNQWQDGYPNPDVIQNDLKNGYGFVLAQGDLILGYTAILINDEPEYDKIEGKWITNDDFVVFHRVAISENQLGKGYAKKMMLSIEEFALAKNIYSIKADTNHDNEPMKSLFEKLGYIYCGQVYFRGSPRKAFEKVITS